MIGRSHGLGTRRRPFRLMGPQGYQSHDGVMHSLGLENVGSQSHPSASDPPTNVLRGLADRLKSATTTGTLSPQGSSRRGTRKHQNVVQSPDRSKVSAAR